MATIFDMELNDADDENRQQDSLEEDSDDHRADGMDNDVEVMYFIVLAI